jgi:hypothetical protein
MTKYIAVFAAVFGLGVGQAFAAGMSSGSNEPTKLTDAQLDEVAAGDPLILVSVMAPISVHIEPITVQVPINVAAIIQANVLGNGAFDAVAVGTQNIFQAGSLARSAVPGS